MASARVLPLSTIEVQVFCASCELRSKVQVILQYVGVQYLELSLMFACQIRGEHRVECKARGLAFSLEVISQSSEVMMKVRCLTGLEDRRGINQVDRSD